MMKGAHFPATAAAFALLALATFHLVSASDPSSLQDFCVALKNTDGIYYIVLWSLYYFQYMFYIGFKFCIFMNACMF